MDTATLKFNTELPINWQLTFLGGQAFNIKLIANSSVKLINTRGTVVIEFDQNNATIYNASLVPELVNTWQNVAHNLNQWIKKGISLLPYAREALNKVGIILPIKQELFLTTTSFIVSANNNINRIRSIITNFINSNNGIYPTYKWFLKQKENGIKKLGTGYRAKYLFNLAKIWERQGLETKISLLKDELEVHKILKTLPGIGPKVADSIIAFSLDFYNITPIDRWAIRYIKTIEPKFKHSGMNYYEYRHFLPSLLGNATLLWGQILFEWIRTTKAKE